MKTFKELTQGDTLYIYEKVPYIPFPLGMGYKARLIIYSLIYLVFPTIFCTFVQKKRVER